MISITPTPLGNCQNPKENHRLSNINRSCSWADINRLAVFAGVLCAYAWEFVLSSVVNSEK